MEYIGIDVASKKLNIHITGKVSDFEIPNDEISIKQFILEQNLKNEDFVIGVESTGKYHLLCQKIFVELGFEFRVINPILTGKKISTTIRKKKTDVSDARIIAQFLTQGEGRKMTGKELNMTKKILMRTRKSIVGQKSSIKVLIKDLGKVIDDPQIKEAIETLKNLVDHMEECVSELEENALRDKETETEKLIRSIPGFAKRLSAVVASEVGDFERFPSSNEFKAYVGIDPKVSQSGGSLHTGKITKRGNPHLRHAFYLAAQVARNHDPELKAFFEKKMSEGKHYRVAMVALSRKLCERVYAVVTKQTPYKIS